MNIIELRKKWLRFVLTRRLNQRLFTALRMSYLRRDIDRIRAELRDLSRVTS
jgi:hypothetical protein